MFATRHFVYVHVPKTGGEFVRKLAAKHFEIVWASPPERYHDAYENLPAEFGHLPALSFVRNPWDYYVSTWAYMIQIGAARGPMAQAAKRGFNEFMRARAARPGGYPDNFVRLARGTEVGRFERLPRDLLAFFEHHAIPTTPELAEDVFNSPAENPTDRGHYRQYYDDETRELVAVKCRALIEAYRYTF